MFYTVLNRILCVIRENEEEKSSILLENIGSKGVKGTPGIGVKTE